MFRAILLGLRVSGISGVRIFFSGFLGGQESREPKDVEPAPCTRAVMNLRAF